MGEDIVYIGERFGVKGYEDNVFLYYEKDDSFVKSLNKQSFNSFVEKGTLKPLMATGGEVESTEKNNINEQEKIKNDISILKISIDSPTTDEPRKNEMRNLLSNLEKKLSDITEKIKVQRNVTIPDNKFWVDIEKKKDYDNIMRNALGYGNIKFESRTVKNKYRIFVKSQELLDRVINIYNLKRAKRKDKPVSASDISGKSEEGGKLWDGNAVKQEVVLRNKLRRMGVLRNDQETLSETDFEKLEQEGEKYKKRVNLVRTKKKFDH